MVARTPGAAAHTRASATSPRARSRPTNARLAPLAPSTIAAASPIPEVAPVITQVLPRMASFRWEARRSPQGGGALDDPMPGAGRSAGRALLDLLPDRRRRLTVDRQAIVLLEAPDRGL